MFEAAQVKMNDRGFLSHDFTVKDLVEVKSNINHFWPHDFLKKNGLSRLQYNQIANYVPSQREINIAIGSQKPGAYMSQVLERCKVGPKQYGNIENEETLCANLAMNCIPEGTESVTLSDNPAFLEARRRLMAQQIKTYFEKP